MTITLTVLHLEVKRLTAEATRWQAVISKAGDLDTPEVRQAVAHTRSLSERVAACERLIGTIPAVTYHWEDVEDAIRLSGKVLTRHAHLKVQHETGAGAKGMESA